MPRIMDARHSTVSVDLTTSGDTVTGFSVTNNDTADAFVTVLSGTTAIVDGLVCPAGQVTSQSFKKNQQFAYSTSANWTIGVSR